MKKLLLFAVFVASGYIAYRQANISSHAPQIAYKDVEGRTHGFVPPCKAAVVAFWRAAPSSRFDRVMAALELVRREHAESRVDVVAICLDRLKPDDVAAGARQAKRTVTMAVAQPGEDRSVEDALLGAFRPGEPGDEIFVVEADGAIHRVDATSSKDTPASLAISVESVLKSAKL